MKEQLEVPGRIRLSQPNRYVNAFFEYQDFSTKTKDLKIQNFYCF